MEKTRKTGPIRRGIRVIGCVLLVLLVAVLFMILWLTVTEYRPEAEEAVAVAGTGEQDLSKGDTLTVMTWNIGYGALWEGVDFFMDGGSGVRTADKEQVCRNMEGISDTIRTVNPDIVLLQEVEHASTRSCGIDEAALLSEDFSGTAAFAGNFLVSYVPYPIPPIGKVDSGLLTLSSFSSGEATRISLPCPFSWPVRTANLKRCLLLQRFPIEEDRELVVVNLHLEAYDDGEGRREQTRILNEVLQEEYEKGNYVIAGGDFNQRFSTTDSGKFPVYEGTWQPGVLDVLEFPEYLRFYQDPDIPSCRSLDRPYAGADPDDFQFYTIDGYIVSDNIRTVDFAALDYGFEYTDHNPVIITVELS